jgi:ribosomal protein L12E/L44/L45/RPP1/RPP2
MKLLFVCACTMLTVFLFACNEKSGTNGNEKYTEVNVSADSANIAGVPPGEVKLVKTAAINFKVKNVEQSIRSVSSLVKSFGGMIYSQDLQAEENDRKELKMSPDSLLVISSYTPRAELTLRVPSEHLEEFMFNAADLGYFTQSNNLNIDDKSLSYLENALKEKNRKEVLAQGLVKRNTAATAGKTIEIKDDVIDKIIENRTIDAEAKFSLVNISLFQNPLVRKEIIANYVISDYQLPVSQKFADALKAGWQYFLALLLLLTHLWVFILLATILIFIYRKNKIIFRRLGV